MMNIQYGSCGGCRVFNVCVVLLAATPWPGWGNMPLFPNCGPQVSIRILLPLFYLRQSAFHFVLSFNCLILCQLFCILRPSTACIHVLVISYCTTSYRLCVRLISVIHDWISLQNAELTFMLVEFGWGQLQEVFANLLDRNCEGQAEDCRISYMLSDKIFSQSWTCKGVKVMTGGKLIIPCTCRMWGLNEKSRTAGGVYDGSHSAMM